MVPAMEAGAMRRAARAEGEGWSCEGPGCGVESNRSGRRDGSKERMREWCTEGLRDTHTHSLSLSLSLTHPLTPRERVLGFTPLSPPSPPLGHHCSYVPLGSSQQCFLHPYPPNSYKLGLLWCNGVRFELYPLSFFSFRGGY